MIDDAATALRPITPQEHALALAFSEVRHERRSFDAWLAETALRMAHDEVIDEATAQALERAVLRQAWRFSPEIPALVEVMQAKRCGHQAPLRTVHAAGLPVEPRARPVRGPIMPKHQREREILAP